jgi:crotonobetainyl-CoA:carnitine CoA-transferase CaiB-like acyl-CoA transferase
VGKVAKAEARHANQTPLMNSYRAADGRWFFLTGLEADRHIDKVYRALGREDLHDDPRFANAASLRRNREEVIAVLDGIIAEHPLQTWAERFDREGVWWAPAQGPADVLEDPQMAATDGYLVLDNDDGTTTRSVNGPVTFSDMALRPAAPAPRLGQHTDEVLKELEQPAPARDRT